MPNVKIHTGLNDIVNIVNRHGELKLADAASLLDLDEKSLEELVKTLLEHKILEIHYSLIGDKILKRGENVNKIISHQHLQGGGSEILGRSKMDDYQDANEIERVLSIMKKKIAEKKGILKPEKGSFEKDLGDVKKAHDAEAAKIKEADELYNKITKLELIAETREAEEKREQAAEAEKLQRLKEELTMMLHIVQPQKPKAEFQENKIEILPRSTNLLVLTPAYPMPKIETGQAAPKPSPGPEELKKDTEKANKPGVNENPTLKEPQLKEMTAIVPPIADPPKNDGSITLPQNLPEPAIHEPGPEAGSIQLSNKDISPPKHMIKKQKNKRHGIKKKSPK